MDIINNNIINQDITNNFIYLAIEINNNYDYITKLEHIKKIIDESELMINKYSLIWNGLNYQEVVSCYIALVYYIILEF